MEIKNIYRSWRVSRPFYAITRCYNVVAPVLYRQSLILCDEPDKATSVFSIVSNEYFSTAPRPIQILSRRTDTFGIIVKNSSSNYNPEKSHKQITFPAYKRKPEMIVLPAFSLLAIAAMVFLIFVSREAISRSFYIGSNKFLCRQS